jgi:hypothetical protein
MEQRMQRYIAGMVASLVLGAATAAQSAVFTVTYEMPGQAATTTVFDISSVEDFNNRALGVNGNFDAFEDLKPGFKGVYANIRVMEDDVYGGAGNGSSEQYAVAGLSGLDNLVPSYSVTFTEGINYFGYWLSALDPGNYVQFYGTNGGDYGLLFEFSPAYFQTLLQNGDVADADDYLGNPFKNYGNDDEYYVFLNFYAEEGVLFDKIVFYQHASKDSAGYESDNHTVGFYLEQGGTPIPEDPSTGEVPAPGALVLMGMGLLGLGVTRRRRP